MSASPARSQADANMARSSRRFGWKMPGVSTRITCDEPIKAMPRTGPRVVCALWVTIDTLAPTSALVRVDLPLFGAPISATKPQRVSVVGPRQPPWGACHTPSRNSMASAAACSASRLLAPCPRSGATPSICTSEVKRGA